MRKFLIILMMVPTLMNGSALAGDGHDTATDDQHDENEGLELLLEARRSGVILPLYAILRSVNEITGEDIVEVEFEKYGDLFKYGIYFLTPQGLRREIYVDARTGEVLEQKAATSHAPTAD